MHNISTGLQRHIVWDWNGTLLDDNPAMLAAVNSVCNAFGRGPITLRHWHDCFERPLRKCYERILDQQLSDEDWVTVEKLYHTAYAREFPSCNLAVDARTALKDWKSSGGTQSLLSMGFHNPLLAAVESFGLADMFLRIDGVREQVSGGTKARHLAKHLSDLEVAAEEVLIIGDVVDDAEAAQYVGSKCILLSTGMMSRNDLEKSGHMVAGSIQEALNRS